MKKLYWNTVTPLLKEVLIDLMSQPIFTSFRLVGGTALSLQVGHRMSVDIDLFTDAEYGSLDFKLLEEYLKNKYSYFSTSGVAVIGMGTSYFVGNSSEDCIKLDLYYTDSFVFDEVNVDAVRLASLEEIIAMKLDVIFRGGRKKDFWDLHYFLPQMNLEKWMEIYKKRYPYHSNTTDLKTALLNFEEAEYDFEPNCILDKNWEIIKLDFFESVLRQ